MSRTRDVQRAEPPWVAFMNDEEIVEKFKVWTENPRVTYEQLGRRTVDIRKRLLRILIDGLVARNKQDRS